MKKTTISIICDICEKEQQNTALSLADSRIHICHDCLNTRNDALGALIRAVQRISTEDVRNYAGIGLESYKNQR